MVDGYQGTQWSPTGRQLAPSRYPASGTQWAPSGYPVGTQQYPVVARYPARAQTRALGQTYISRNSFGNLPCSRSEKNFRKYIAVTVFPPPPEEISRKFAQVYSLDVTDRTHSPLPAPAQLHISLPSLSHLSGISLPSLWHLSHISLSPRRTRMRVWPEGFRSRVGTDGRTVRPSEGGRGFSCEQHQEGGEISGNLPLSSKEISEKSIKEIYRSLEKNVHLPQARGC